MLIFNFPKLSLSYKSLVPLAWCREISTLESLKMGTCFRDIQDGFSLCRNGAILNPTSYLTLAGVKEQGLCKTILNKKVFIFKYACIHEKEDKKVFFCSAI